jgi:hypothetical protein
MIRQCALWAWVIGVLALLGGCSNTRTQTYDVTVKNGTSQPLMLWMTKNGPPLERGWFSPEDVAIIHPSADDLRGEVVLNPGKIGSTNALKGEFAPGVQGVLRIYAGTHRLNELLAIDRGNPARLDIPLEPGKNALIVNEENGRLTYETLSPSAGESGSVGAH